MMRVRGGEKQTDDVGLCDVLDFALGVKSVSTRTLMRSIASSEREGD